MTKLKWDELHRTDKIRENKGIPASECSSRDFSRNHLQPSPGDRAKYLKHIRKLVQEVKSAKDNPSGWLKQFDELETHVPRWLDDAEIKGELAQVRQTAEKFRSQIAGKKSAARKGRLHEKMDWLEQTIVRGEFHKIDFEGVQECVHLLEALAPSLPRAEKLTRRIALRKSLQSIGEEKLAHWEAKGYPGPFPLHGWLDLFESFAPELKKHPGFKLARAQPRTVWI